MPDYYDPQDGWTPQRRGKRIRQSLLSVALEALGGGFVIAAIVITLWHALRG